MNETRRNETKSSCRRDMLADADRTLFAAAGISIETATAAGVHRVSHAEAQALGLSYKGDLGGIAFPYHHPRSGRIVGWRVRRDHPDVDERGRPKAKYLSTPDRRHLYFSPGAGNLVDDVAVSVVVVEGRRNRFWPSTTP